jgi:hypothetical protein
MFVEHIAHSLGLDPEGDHDRIRSRFLGVVLSLCASVGLEVDG